MEPEALELAGADAHTIQLYVGALMDGEPNWVATLANVSAVLHEAMGRVNWTGFYIMIPSGQELVVGPFQGRVACTRIAVGRGVVGTAVKERRTMVVPDVGQFPGHIACDSASRSEVVVPIFAQSGELVGVLDVDSPELGRFGESEVATLEAVAQRIGRAWPSTFQQL